MIGISELNDDKKQLIIASAVNLFDKYGYNNVKIAQITKEIGLTTGAFYYYFNNKEEVLQTIYNYYITLAVEMIEEIHNATQLSTQEKIHELIKRHVKIIRDHHAYVSVFFRENKNLSSESLEIIKNKNDQFLFYSNSIVQAGMNEGAIPKDLNPKIVSLAIIGMCNWIYQWYREDGDLGIDEIGEIYFQFISTGLFSKDLKLL